MSLVVHSLHTTRCKRCVHIHGIERNLGVCSSGLRCRLRRISEVDCTLHQLQSRAISPLSMLMEALKIPPTLSVDKFALRLGINAILVLVGHERSVI